MPVEKKMIQLFYLPAKTDSFSSSSGGEKGKSLVKHVFRVSGKPRAGWHSAFQKQTGNRLKVN